MLFRIIGAGYSQSLAWKQAESPKMLALCMLCSYKGQPGVELE